MAINPLRKEDTSVAKVTERAKPELVIVSGKTIIPGGRWNDEAMANYVIQYGLERWVVIGELAKVIGSNTSANQKRVRKNIPKLFLYLMHEKKLFLATEHDSKKRNITKAVKIADLSSEQDRQNVDTKMQKLRKRQMMSVEAYEEAMALIYGAKLPIAE